MEWRVQTFCTSDCEVERLAAGLVRALTVALDSVGPCRLVQELLQFALVAWVRGCEGVSALHRRLHHSVMMMASRGASAHLYGVPRGAGKP